MKKVRSNAWTEEQDLLLAETVLRYIREGKTQQSAFADISEKLGRTEQAVSFRWNSELKLRFEKAVQLAMQMKKTKSPMTDSKNEKNMSLQDAINVLVQYVQNVSDSEELVVRLQTENERLKKQIQDLVEENRTYLSIFERAKSMITAS